jgi:hypothetical protein
MILSQVAERMFGKIPLMFSSKKKNPKAFLMRPIKEDVTKIERETQARSARNRSTTSKKMKIQMS